MANIKITELNSLTTKENNDVLPIVDVSVDETKKIKIEDLLDKNVSLLAVTDTAPSECSTGDKYYNTIDKLIYTATATNTWSENGEEPIEGILYIVFDSENNQGNSYAWNGTDLSSVGGGGGTDEVIISDEQPQDDDWKIWIDSGEVNNLGSEVVDTLTGDETNLAPSVRAVKEDLNTYSTTEQRVGTWIDGKPLYRIVLNVTLPSGAYNNDVVVADLTNLNIDKMIKLEGMIYSSSTSVIINIAYKGTQQYCSMYYTNNTKYLRYSTNNQQYVDVPANIIIEYTKTTD